MGEAKMKKMFAMALAIALCLCLCSCGNKTEEKGYIIKVTDAQGKGVEGVKLDICDDKTCTLFTTDKNGEVKPEIQQGDYTVHLLKLPEGYSKTALEQEYKLTATAQRLEIKLD